MDGHVLVVWTEDLDSLRQVGGACGWSLATKPQLIVTPESGGFLRGARVPREFFFF